MQAVLTNQVFLPLQVVPIVVDGIEQTAASLGG